MKAAVEDPELPVIQEWAKRIFIDECSVLEAADGSGHTPHYIDEDMQQQTSDMPYPGGYLHILLMSFVPGISPLAIFHDLTENDLDIIRTQITQTMRWESLLCFSKFLSFGSKQNFRLTRKFPIIL